MFLSLRFCSLTYFFCLRLCRLLRLSCCTIYSCNNSSLRYFQSLRGGQLFHLDENLLNTLIVKATIFVSLKDLKRRTIVSESIESGLVLLNQMRSQATTGIPDYRIHPSSVNIFQRTQSIASWWRAPVPYPVERLPPGLPNTTSQIQLCECTMKVTSQHFLSVFISSTLNFTLS